MAVRPLNVLSLCSGYGGLELGLHLATGGAARCVCYVEREASAAAVLVKEMEAGNLAEAPIWSDLATFDARPWRGVVDCVTAGFPCQPASVAGARRGTDDPRWLWPLVARVVEDCGADMVFCENVPGLRQKGMPEVLGDLAALGYDAQWGCVSAGALGAPHRRDRFWLLAYRDAGWLRERLGDTPGEGLPLRQGLDGDPFQEQPAAERAGGAVVYADHEPRDRPVPKRLGEAAEAGAELGDTDGQRGGQPNDPGAPLHGVWKPREGVGRTSVRPWPPGPGCGIDRWPAEEPQPSIRRKAHGSALALGLELRMLGNGVVPVVAAYAFRALARRAIDDE